MRHAKLDDYKYISNISKELHIFHVKNRPDIYKEVNKTIYKSYFKELLNDENIEIIVIAKDKKIVGYAMIRYIEIKSMDLLNDKFFAYIDEICIKESDRGQGLGRMLFDYSYDLVKSNGAESLELGVWSFNEGAIGFYRAMGMVEKNIRMEKK
ncbi:MAG: GNAT family N-acetyltransferase [Clostridium sp.]|uniref:GNAT family N-acetyltransferase n=1 Tax=Clostridium TaxID=1485 RepID=UPI0005503233|nr:MULTISPECIES: GNAT family N-acetyltransferase [Clostridium]MBS5306584.1 GNAT family N-acetyltransferase [Clostridium sp.]MBU6134527.1 GNAT family N-acetyltransferase [Clostridium tertium]MDU2461228.1 GNAT family N-acetyltransferase [Clostridium sp.]MDU2682515.1 GNAT family N-acetyltransferase [Clostridium sp.]MDU8967596.1 GNAT family N-acetyltransferase [Clostridium sp.]